MIFALAALVLSGGSTFPPTDVVASDLPQLFIDACLDGQVKLSPEDATPVSFDSLPAEFQKRLTRPTSAQIWRINAPGDAFLYVFNYQRLRDMSPRICGVASDQMNYGEAADAVEKRVTGEVHPRTTRSVKWTDADDGYIAIATTAGKFSVLQVNMMNDAERAAVRKAYQTVAR